MQVIIKGIFHIFLLNELVAMDPPFFNCGILQIFKRLFCFTCRFFLPLSFFFDKKFLACIVKREQSVNDDTKMTW